jgi:hypothetical protein
MASPRDYSRRMMSILPSAPEPTAAPSFALPPVPHISPIQRSPARVRETPTKTLRAVRLLMAVEIRFAKRAVSFGGTIVADGRSMRGICTCTATSSSAMGLYGTGPNETLTTRVGITIGGGIPMTQARTVSTLQVTATHAGVNVSSGVVTVLKNGSTTTITCTIGTGTSCNDFTHTVSFSAGDLLSIQFTTQAYEVLAGVQAQVIWQ